jgi:hypothetical protein
MQFIELIAGIVLVLAAVASLYFSLPRGGKTARFVGSQWEGYVVTAMIGFFAIGMILTFRGLFV